MRSMDRPRGRDDRKEVRLTESLKEAGYDLLSPIDRFALAASLEGSEETVSQLLEDLESSDPGVIQLAALALTRFMNEDHYRIFRERFLVDRTDAADASEKMDQLQFGQSIVVRNIPDATTIRHIIDGKFERGISLYPDEYPAEFTGESFLIMVFKGELRLVVYRARTLTEGEQHIYEGDAVVEEKLRDLGIIGNTKADIVFTEGGSWCPITLPYVAIDGHSHPAGESEFLMPSHADMGTNWEISVLKGRIDFRKNKK